MSPNANPRDPWEPFNRKVTAFNDGLDDAVVRPVATAYQHVLPQMVRTGVTNFFGNISDVWSVVNNVLQLKPRESAEMAVRVGVNTVFGLAGLIDVATEMKIERHREDFGQTLGYWGVGTGPYLVLPLLGPSTLRDTLALPLNSQGDMVNQVTDTGSRISLFVLRGVDLRAGLLGAGNFLDNAALDKYSFLRDAFLQRRRGEVGRRSDVDSPNDAPPAAEERYDLPEGESAPPAAPSSTAPAEPDATAPAAPAATAAP